MPRVVIADTSPLHYLILIGQAELLPALYTEVLIPEAVADELSQPATPEPVRGWIVRRPSWLRVVPLTARPPSVSLPDLDSGEHDAILLALQVKADLVLMDEREAVEEARRLGLTVTGTLGVLDRAAERGLIELAPAIARLRQTNFRVDPALLDRLLAADRRKREKQIRVLCRNHTKQPFRSNSPRPLTPSPIWRYATHRKCWRREWSL